MKYLQLIIIFIICISNAWSNDLRKIVKSVEKADYDRAFVLLNQSLEKETINPGAKWYLAELFSTDTLDFYQLDSARILIQSALTDFDSSSQKTIDLLAKQGYSRETLNTTFDKIKMISLRDAIKQNSVEALERFAIWYPDTPGQQTALRLRDSLAFLAAQDENTWKAMTKYIAEYPQSHWIIQAKVRYEKLLYGDFTKDGSKNSFEIFVEKYQESPYIEDAVNRIYDFISVYDKPDIWKTFVQKYPNSKSAKKALDRLYHLDKLAFFKNQSIMKTPRIDSFISIYNMESIPLLPIIENEKIGFVNHLGEYVIPAFYQPITVDPIFCKVYEADFFAAEKNVINRNMVPITAVAYDNIYDIGNGVLHLKSGDSGKLMFKNGELIADNISESVLFDQKWIKAKRNGKYGLLSTSGNQIAGFQYDEIAIKGDFWVFFKDKLIAVTNEKQIISETGEGGFTLEFKFEEIELINDQLIIGFNDGRECMLNSKLEFLIPWGVYEVNPDPNIAFVKKPDLEYQIFNNKINQLAGTNTFRQLNVTGKWLAVKNEKWQLLNLENESILQFDSVKLINDFAALIVEKGGTAILFPNGQKIPLAVKQTVRDLSFSTGNAKSEFLEIATEKTKSVWDRYGQFLFQGNFDDVIVLTDSLFRISIRKKQGVVDRDGFYVVEPEYDFIQIKDDLLQLLKNNKIGTYDLKHQLLLADSFDAGFDRFGDYYITSKNGLKGVIDRENNRLIDFLYNDIQFFNDTASWVLSDSSWQVLSHRKQQILISNVQKIEFLHALNGEQFFSFLTSAGYGIISSTKGMILVPAFTEINLWLVNKIPLFLGEYYHGKTDYYLLGYYNLFGEKVYSGAQKSSIYEQYYCE